MTPLELMVDILLDNTTRQLTIYDWIDKAVELAEHLPKIVDALEQANDLATSFENLMLHHKQSDSDAYARQELHDKLVKTLRELGVRDA